VENEQPVCLGSEITLTGKGAYNYEWNMPVLAWRSIHTTIFRLLSDGSKKCFWMY
jgi:hypothetical protein